MSNMHKTFIDNYTFGVADVEYLKNLGYSDGDLVNIYAQTEVKPVENVNEGVIRSLF